MKDLFKAFHISDFINKPGKQTEFEILLFNEMEEPQVDDFHRHTFYEILWTEKGKSKQTIDFQEFEVAENTMFFISPNQVHFFEEWHPLTGGTILFTEDFFLLNHSDKSKLLELTFLDNIYVNPCIPLSHTNFGEVKETIDLILKEQKRQDKNLTIVQSLLHILLAQVQRCVDNNLEKPYPKTYLLLFKHFKMLIENHYPENRTADFYAKSLSITSHHLNRISKSISGKTATEVIRGRTVLEAKRYLTYSDFTISEIAAKLNYFDSSYFAKLFKAETGVAPGVFRDKMSQLYRIR